MDAIIARNIIELAGAMMEEFEATWNKINEKEINQLNYHTIKLHLSHIKEQRDLLINANTFNSYHFPNLLVIRKSFMQKYIPIVAAADLYMIRYKKFDIE